MILSLLKMMRLPIVLCQSPFFDGDKWITTENPLLEGTCRARLLDQDLISIQKISVNQLQSFSKMMLINAMLDFDEKRAIQISPKTFVFN